jgi:signal transduction histidine kinase
VATGPRSRHRLDLRTASRYQIGTLALDDLLRTPQGGGEPWPVGEYATGGGGPGSPPVVLVIDDNEANRLLARDTLEDEGYRVVLAENGQQGVEAFERERPDCVLLDVRMPGLDGFEVCRRLRGLKAGEEVPILFLTAQRDVDTFDQALRAGGDDFLTKPVRPTELVVRVQTALKLRRVGAELREQYVVLKRHRDELLRLQLQKERLMSFVVHDLKNPVGSMDLNAQIILRRKDLPEDVRSVATQIRQDARQLHRMIMNLLDLAKADEGKLVPQRSMVDIKGLVEGVSDELHAAASARSVGIRSELGIGQANVDPDLLRRALANLIENAARHAPPETDVVVTAAGGPALELRIADHGTGIPLEMREKVFDPFVQIEAGGAALSRGGRGLGLTFCRSAVEAHGGRIWIEDAAPGAVFCISIPDAL